MVKKNLKNVKKREKVKKNLKKQLEM